MHTGLRFVEIAGDHSHVAFCSSVHDGLSAPTKSLPTRFLYDSAGSYLFEEITKLPEYYLTRCEQEIFESSAAEIVRQCGDSIVLVEFGSGSSKKTRLLMDAALESQRHLEYVPIDISSEHLRETSLGLLEAYSGLSITALAGEYFDSISSIPEAAGPRLILFLGSNIGNFTREEAVSFLAAVRAQMTPKDRLLVGIDLAKESDIVFGAYNEDAGLTAQFNLNLLNRVNVELGGHFDLDLFRHSAPYDEIEQRIEMRLYSIGDQTVSIDALETAYEIRDGEFIHTEWSHKYTEERFAEIAIASGLEPVRTWKDTKCWFATVMLRAS